MAKVAKKVGGSKALPAKKSAKKAAKLGDPRDTMEFIADQYQELSEQMEQFEAGKKVAVGRARKAANELRKALANFRKEIQAAKSEM